MRSSLRSSSAFFVAVLSSVAASQACGFSLEADGIVGDDAAVGTSSGTTGAGSSSSSSGALTSSSGSPSTSSSSGDVSSSSSSGGDVSSSSSSSGGSDLPDASDSPDAEPAPCEPIVALPNNCSGADVACRGNADLNSDRLRLNDDRTGERGILWTRRTISRERAFTWVVTGSLRTNNNNNGKVGHGLALAFVGAANDDAFPGISPTGAEALGLAGLPGPFAGGAGYLRTRGGDESGGRLVLGNAPIPTTLTTEIDGFWNATSNVTFMRDQTPRIRLTATHTAAAATAELRLEYRYADDAPWVALPQTAQIPIPAVTSFVGIAGATGHNTNTQNRITSSVLTCQ